MPDENIGKNLEELYIRRSNLKCLRLNLRGINLNKAATQAYCQKPPVIADKIYRIRIITKNIDAFILNSAPR